MWTSLVQTHIHKLTVKNLYCDICRAHGLIHHFYAEDPQIYIAFKPMDSVSQNEVIKRVEHCLSDIVS